MICDRCDSNGMRVVSLWRPPGLFTVRTFTFKRLKRTSPVNHLCTVNLDRAVPYNFAADSFRTNLLCSRLSRKEIQFHVKNVKTVSAFWSPLGEGLGAAYTVHFRLVGKPVDLLDFLLLTRISATGKSTTRPSCLFVRGVIPCEYRRDWYITEN